MTLIDISRQVGALPLACGRQPAAAGPSPGVPERLPPRRAVGHVLLSTGGVRVQLPNGGVLTEAEACRLAWGLLNDLAPDEVVPAADVVTYKEAQRLAVLRTVGRRIIAASDIGAALGWGSRVVQRRLEELVGDGRLRADGRGKRGRTYSLVRGDVEGAAR